MEDNIAADRFDVSSIENHPDFLYSTLAYDVSILTLATRITFSSTASLGEMAVERSFSIMSRGIRWRRFDVA